MTALIEALFTNPFLQTALFVGLLASLSSGAMGCYVVIRKITSITGSISHSILGGIGLFLWLKFNKNMPHLDPIYGAFAAAIVSAFLIHWAHLRYKQKEGAIIATIWSSGMAIGVIFVSLIEGYKVDFSNFLFGNILLVNPNHIYILIGLDGLLIILIALFYKKFLLICLDEELAQLQKIHLHSLYFLLLSMIALSIVLLVQAMGIILVIALITIPATISAFFTKNLIKMMVLATLFCALFIESGTLIAYTLDWPPGATAAVVAGGAYLLMLALRSQVVQKKILKKELS